MTQQAFHNAIRQWDQFDGSCQRISWLHAILVNCIRDWIRRRAARADEPFEQWSLVPADEGYDASDLAARRECHQELRKAIKNLGKTLRATFVAAVLDGYSYQQIAEMLSIPVGTVASRVYQARQQLASIMRRAYPE